MASYDFSYDEQAQSKSALHISGRRHFSSHKRVENRILQVWRNRRALVRDPNLYVRSEALGSDSNMFPRGVNHGICHEIEDNLPEPLSIPVSSQIANLF